MSKLYNIPFFLRVGMQFCGYTHTSNIMMLLVLRSHFFLNREGRVLWEYAP